MLKSGNICRRKLRGVPAEKREEYLDLRARHTDQGDGRHSRIAWQVNHNYQVHQDAVAASRGISR